MSIVEFKACAVADVREEGVWYASIHCVTEDTANTYAWCDRRYSGPEPATAFAQTLLDSMRQGMLVSALHLPGIVHQVALFGVPGKSPGNPPTH